MANFVDWMCHVMGQGVLRAPRGVSSAPLKHQRPPSIYLSYFASQDLMHVDVFPTRVPLSASEKCSGKRRGKNRLL